MRYPGNQANAALFAFAYLLSAFGYEFLTFVLTVRIYQLTGRAADVGIFMAVSFLPRVFSPFYGAMADRYPRNVLFFAACLATAAGTPLLARQTTLAGLYTTWFVISVLAMAILNLRSTVLTQVMSGRHRHHANGMILVFLNVARLAAPVLGGIAATVWSLAGVLSVGSAVYVCAAAAALAMRLPDVRRMSAPGILSHLREGMSLIWRNPDLVAIVYVSFVWRLCLGFQSGLLVVYVVQALGKGPVEFGVLTSALAVGSVLGCFAGPWIGKRAPAHLVMKTGMAAFFTLTGLLGLISSFALAVVDTVIASFALYAAAVAVHAARDQVIPAEYRGRILGCNTLITAVPALVSMLLGGWLTDVIGIRAVFLGGGVLAMAGLGAFMLSPLAQKPAAAAP